MAGISPCAFISGLILLMLGFHLQNPERGQTWEHKGGDATSCPSLLIS